MSWVEAIQRTLEVVTGEGKIYKPLWKNAVKEIEYNVTSFNFPNLEGTQVQRRKQRGRLFDVTFYFTGESHLDVSSEFEESAKDPRHWHIRHPLFGDIRCQPSGLRFDNSQQNLTVITGKVIETLNGISPIGVPNPKDELDVKFVETAVLSSASVVQSTTTVSPSDFQFLNNEILNFETRYAPVINNVDDATRFSKLLEEAKSRASDFTGDFLLTLKAVQSVVMFPARMESTVYDRLRYLKAEIDRTRTSILGLGNISINRRRNFQNIVGDLLSAHFEASVNPLDNDFETRQQVLDVIEENIELWNQFIIDIDDLQLIKFEEIDSYIPEVCHLQSLEDLFNDTIANLEGIALNSKKELSINIECDSNIIVLTHRFYGLDNEDENLDFFIRTNDLNIYQLLQIRKDTLIKWYV